MIFLDERPPRGALDHATGRVDEDMRLGKQEIYVAYPNGMGRSKLRIPAAKMGTARNLNTVAALVEIACKEVTRPANVCTWHLRDPRSVADHLARLLG